MIDASCLMSDHCSLETPLPQGEIVVVGLRRQPSCSGCGGYEVAVAAAVTDSDHHGGSTGHLQGLVAATKQRW